jgi:hypothetical protein
MFHDDGIHTFLANFLFLLVFYYLKLTSPGHCHRHGLRYAEHVRQRQSFPFGCRGDLAGLQCGLPINAVGTKALGAPRRLSISVLLYTGCVFDPAEPCQ